MRNVSVKVSPAPGGEEARVYLVLQSIVGETWTEEKRVEIGSQGPAVDASFNDGQRVVIENCPGYEIVYDKDQAAAIYKEKEPLAAPEGEASSKSEAAQATEESTEEHHSYRSGRGTRSRR